MPVYVSPEKILAKFNDFPIEVITTDMADQPVSVSYADVHRVLTLDVGNLLFEQSVLANTYAEMARWSAICGFQAARAGAAFARWKAQRAAELAKNFPVKKTASGKPSAKQGPTKDEIADFYRTHEDYEEMSGAEAKWTAFTHLFDDLKWAVKMKAEAAASVAQSVGGFERTSAQEVETLERLEDYESVVAEHNRLLAQSNEGLTE